MGEQQRRLLVWTPGHQEEKNTQTSLQGKEIKERARTKLLVAVKHECVRAALGKMIKGAQ